MNDELRQAAERVKQHAEYYLREYVLEDHDDSDLRRHLRDQLALANHYLSTPDQSAEVARLTAEIERLREDAERWIYAASLATYGTAPSFAHPKRSGSWCEILIPRESNQDVTAAIDAARKETI